MRIAQILNGKAHWIFEAAKAPSWPPDLEGNPVVLADISGMPEVKEGWLYDVQTGEFCEPVKVGFEKVTENDEEGLLA